MSNHKKNEDDIPEKEKDFELSTGPNYNIDEDETRLFDVPQCCCQAENYIDEYNYFSNIDLSHYKRNVPKREIRKIKIIDA